jgi:hypothetical protein
VPEKGYPHVSAEVSASLGRRTSVPARSKAELTEPVIDIKRALIASGNLDQGTVSPHGGGGQGRAKDEGYLAGLVRVHTERSGRNVFIVGPDSAAAVLVGRPSHFGNSVLGCNYYLS